MRELDALLPNTPKQPTPLGSKFRRLATIDLPLPIAAWKGEDANMRMVAEVIASAFASGLSWKGTLAAKEVYCPPQGFNGGQVMAALDQFLVSNPDMAEKSYGDAMAASLSQAFPCQPQ